MEQEEFEESVFYIAYTVEELERQAQNVGQPMGRVRAAEILHQVALQGQAGATVKGLSPFAIGRAISRIVSNYSSGPSDETWHSEFLRGLGGPR